MNEAVTTAREALAEAMQDSLGREDLLWEALRRRGFTVTPLAEAEISHDERRAIVQQHTHVFGAGSVEVDGDAIITTVLERAGNPLYKKPPGG